MSSLPSINLDRPMAIEDGLARLSTNDDAMRAVLALGFRPPPASAVQFNAELGSLSRLSDEEIGDMLYQLSEYTAFTEFKLAELQGQRNTAETQLQFIESQVRISLRMGEKLTVQEKEDITRTNERVVEAKARFDFLSAQCDIINVIKTSNQRRWETVSRHITQRGQAIDRFRRDDNVGNAPMSRFRRSPR